MGNFTLFLILMISWNAKAQLSTDSIEINTAQNGWESLQSDGSWGGTSACNYVKSIFDRYSHRFPGMDRDDLRCGPFLRQDVRRCFSSSSQTTSVNKVCNLATLRKEVSLPINAKVDSIKFIYLCDDFIDSIIFNEVCVYAIDTVHYGQFPIEGFKADLGNSKAANYLYIHPSNVNGPYGTYFKAKIYYTLMCEDLGSMCLDDSISLESKFPENASYDSIVWAIQDSMDNWSRILPINDKHKFENPGEYTIYNYVYRANTIDTFCFNVDLIPSIEFDLAEDTGFCQNWSIDNLDLMPLKGYQPYSPIWSTGSKLPSITVNDTGIYWLQDSNVCGVARDSIHVFYNNYSLPQFSLQSDSSICLGDSIRNLKLYPLNAYVAQNPQWSTMERSDTILVNDIGLYWMSDSNQCGVYADTVSLYLSKIGTINFQLNADTSYCKDVVIQNLQLYPISDYIPINPTWSTGEISDTIKVNEPGEYWMKDSNFCGTFTDTVQVKRLDISRPSFDLLADSSICPGELNKGLKLYTLNPYTGWNMMWSTQENADTIMVKDTGTYWLRDSNLCGVFYDSVRIFYTKELPPFFELPQDTTLCSSEDASFLKLYAINGYKPWNPLWSTMDRSDTILVQKEGSYFLRDSNRCGMFIDSIDVSYTDCEVVINIPNIFTPNGDGMNDLFLPYDISGATDVRFDIYNRWGECVFKNGSVTVGWDGTTNGKELPEATYYWVMKYTSFDGETQSIGGMVELVR
ncbi:gliding motility-associated C-terminal domain-containing protein [bacterium]|nr:gliding motility-associated C-terminal domain-containing protein [bacterium]